jgi:hypothetical protein
MSTHIVVTTPEPVSQPALHASFLGIMRGVLENRASLLVAFEHFDRDGSALETRCEGIRKGED